MHACAVYRVQPCVSPLCASGTTRGGVVVCIIQARACVTVVSVCDTT
jgi:hypothetical protein